MACGRFPPRTIRLKPLTPPSDSGKFSSVVARPLWRLLFLPGRRNRMVLILLGAFFPVLKCICGFSRPASWDLAVQLLCFAAVFQHACGSQVVDRELSDILNELWKLDKNRLRPEIDYRISLQGKAGYVASGSTVTRDYASAPLFSYVDEEKLKSIKTFSNLMNLLDNYEPSTGVAEKVTAEEIAENNRFLNAILETEVMKRTHQYLTSKRQSRSSQRDFKNQLYDIWFRLYHRDRQGGEDSCGFEHVFVGETKYGKEPVGLHNWVQFYLLEKQHQVDYKGYKARDKDVPDKDDHILSLQFSWNNLVKPVGSAFIGVSPEFEVAAFTILFLKSKEKATSAVVNMDEYQVELVVHRHGRSIGTAYPKLLSSNNRHF